jgi:hypothetical protein
VRRFLFGLHAKVLAQWLQAIDTFHDRLTDLLLDLGIFHQQVVAKAGYFLMRVLYSDLLEETEQQMALQTQTMELTLLAKATELKEHAVEIGDWTEHHTLALNAIGKALVEDCQWEEVHVHAYLKNVVESVPGLYYQAGEEDDLE